MDSRAHWEKIFAKKAPTQLSWYQAHPQQSLQMIAECGLTPDARIIDIGGGTSLLVDFLLDAGYRNVTVLDIAANALEENRRRLGARANAVSWIEADVTRAPLFPNRYDLWHDRAVFHFLLDPADRQNYTDALRRSLYAGGHVILATFASDGPQKCSGLDVLRYGADEIAAAFGEEFRLIGSLDERHQTPSDTIQKFTYFHLVRE